jgi:hypothetical protein
MYFREPILLSTFSDNDAKNQNEKDVVDQEQVLTLEDMVRLEFTEGQIRLETTYNQKRRALIKRFGGKEILMLADKDGQKAAVFGVFGLEENVLTPSHRQHFLVLTQRPDVVFAIRRPGTSNQVFCGSGAAVREGDDDEVFLT